MSAKRSLMASAATPDPTVGAHGSHPRVRPAGHRSPLFQTTPESTDPTIDDFCAGFGSMPPVRVPVRPAPDGEAGRCCFNVARVIARGGGNEVFGWIVWKGQLFLTAEFHAIWWPPEGDPLDVTPKPDGETSILFSPDPAYQPGFDFMKRPNNRTLRTYSAPRDVRGALARMSMRQRLYEEKRAARAGVALADSLAAKLPGDALERDVDEFLALSARKDELLRPSFEGMVCSDVPLYRALTSRMGAVQARIERTFAAQRARR